MDLNQTLTNIFGYYSYNIGCDPNIEEFIRVCDNFTDYLKESVEDYGIRIEGDIVKGEDKYPKAAAIAEKFVLYKNQVFNKLLNNNLDITEKSPLYKLCEESYAATISYVKLEDIELRRLVGGVSLYIAQGRRGVNEGLSDQFVFDNGAQLDRINFLYNTNSMDSNGKVTPMRNLINDINNSYNTTYTRENTTNKIR